MYTIRNMETKEFKGVRLNEQDAYDLRQTFDDWEDLEIIWQDTEADILLERLAEIGGRRTELRDSNGLRYCFQLNDMNEIERIFVACVDIEVESIGVDCFNNTLHINDNIDIRVNTMELRA